jgi:uncharacterized protein (TIGR02145 family)
MRKLYLFIFLSPFFVRANAQTVPSIVIGTQVWSASNLDVATYRNGDSIPQVESRPGWIKTYYDSTPAWCYYDSTAATPEMKLKYGKLYNWYAVNDPRGLAPAGWHVATDSDWTVLENFLGTDSAGDKMKSLTGWDGPCDSNVRCNFSAAPGGHRSWKTMFLGMGKLACFWTSTNDPDKAKAAWNRFVLSGIPKLVRGYSAKNCGFSVRLVRDPIKQ